jgi:hypothetical protein
MKREIYLSLVITILTLSSCYNSKNNDSINDPKYRNEKYDWWVDSTGKGSWVEFDEEGDFIYYNGKATEFYENGKVKTITPYLDGKITGRSKKFNVNGQLVSDGFVTNNRPDSLLIIYYPNGKIRSKTLLKNCSPNFIEVFNMANHCIARLNLKKSEYGNRPEGKQYIFHPNGKPKIIFNDTLLTIYDEQTRVIRQDKTTSLINYYSQSITEIAMRFLIRMNYKKPMSTRFGCISGDCINGFGNFISENGSNYAGHFKNGFFNGQGLIKDISGDTIYVGNFENDLFSGKGKHFGKYPKFYYEGDFQFGTYNGYGHSLSPDNYEYWGQFKNECFNGNGKIVYSDGSYYVGEFKNDKPHGKGTYFEPDGQITEGEWERGNQILYR